MQARKETGGFRSIEHLCQNSDLGGVGKKALESLIRAGALDDFGDRLGMLEVIDRIVSLAQSEAHLRNSQQTSMFDMMGDSMPAELASIDVPDLSTSDAEKGQWEQELLGVSTSNNALLDLLARSRDANEIVMLNDLQPDMVGKRVRVTGMVSDVTRRYTREQKPFAIVSLVLMDGAIEVFVWDEVLQVTGTLWEDGKLVAVTGTVRQRDDELSISCLEAQEVKLTADDAPELVAADSTVESQAAADPPPIPTNGTAPDLQESEATETVPGEAPVAVQGSAAVAEAAGSYGDRTPDASYKNSVSPPLDEAGRRLVIR